MKAASNALSLAARWSGHRPAQPGAAPQPGVVRALVELAEEELAHFRRVLDELERRGIRLGPPPVDPYAERLRRAAGATRSGRDGVDPLVDRLLVGALIEARSCERFRLLADALARRGDALAAFYEELFASEARHYRTLLDLAGAAAGDEAAVRARLDELARAEGDVVAELGALPAIHG